MWPPAYRQFVEFHGLAGAEIEIPEADDLSGMGGTFQIFDEAGAAADAKDFYPALVVKEDGFVPVGFCVLGSGDPYFINSRDEPPGPVYRIWHEAVLDSSYDRDAAIASVLASYEELLRYRTA